MTSTRRIKLCLLLAACLLLASCLVPGATSQAQQPAQNPATALSKAPAASEVIWMNTASGYYHEPSSRHYGKTKHGKYVQDSDAVRAGYRPARNEGRNQMFVVAQ